RRPVDSHHSLRLITITAVAVTELGTISHGRAAVPGHPAGCDLATSLEIAAPLPSPDGRPGLACDHPEAGAWDLTHGRSGRRRGPTVRTRQRGPIVAEQATGAPEEEVTGETSFPGRGCVGSGGLARCWVRQAQLVITGLGCGLGYGHGRL